jgi:hypothetical protein
MGLKKDTKTQLGSRTTKVQTVSSYDHFSFNHGPTVDNDYDPFNT